MVAARLRVQPLSRFRSQVAALVVVPIFCASTSVTVTRGCPYSIRDAAFMSIDEPARFELYFLAPESEESRRQLETWVAAASETWLADTNVTARVIDRGNRELKRLEESLSSAEVDSDAMPSVVLIAPEGDALVLSQTPSAQITMDDVMDAMVRAVESPARTEMRDHLVESWCVVILLKGDDEAEADRADETIRHAAERITGTTTEMDKVVTTPPHVVVVDCDDPDEKPLLWSLGLANSNLAAGEPRPTRAIMLAGRGRQRGPVFEGEDLSADNLLDAFTMLGRSCSCTTSPLWLSGKSVALRWGLEMETAVQIELGFDPDDPDAIALLRGTMGGSGGTAGGGGLGYSETLFISAAPTDAANADSNAPAADDAAPKDEQQLASLQLGDSMPGGTRSRADESSEALDAPSGFPALGMMIVTALAVLAVATIVVWRRSQTA